MQTTSSVIRNEYWRGVGLIRLKTSGERSQREGQSDSNCYDCKYLHAGGRSGNLFTTDHSTLIQCATQRVGLRKIL